MAFSFAPTYQDYLSYYGKGGDGALSQDQWNALGTAGQWNNLGGGLALDKSDPRYAALAQQLGITDGGLINLGYKPQSLAINGRNFVDPNAVLQGDDVFATAHTNETPSTQFAGGGLSDKGWALAAISLLAGGAALGGALGGAAGAGGAGGVSGSSALTTGGFGTDISAGSGAFAGGGAAGAAGAVGDASTGVGGSSWDGSFGDGGGLDPETASGQYGGMGNVADGGTYAGPAISDPSSGSSLLHNLNTARQYFNGARSVMNLLSGGQSGSRSRGMGDSSCNWLTSLLGLLAGGHQAFGGGVGTASGAQAVADHASQLADPWGSSGNRGKFMDLLTPDKFMSLVSQDPSAVVNNPAYKFDLNQGINAINMGDAAQGTLRSGNRGVELEQFGQGLASKYGQQMFNNNITTLQQLAGLAGVNAGSPTASAQALMNGFDNASNIRNAGTNSLFNGGSSNPLMGGLSGILSLLGQGGSSIGSWISNLFGSDSTGSVVDDFLNSGSAAGDVSDMFDLSGGVPF